MLILLKNVISHLTINSTLKSLEDFLSMSRAGISYFDVAKAAEQIVGCGKTPTIEQVRNLLGTGSNSTIGPHLRTWRNQQEPNQRLALQSNLPEELIALMKGLWERVILESNTKIEKITQDLEQEINKLQQQVQTLQQEHAKLQQEHAKEKHRNSNLLQEKEAIEQMLNLHKTDLIALQIKQDGMIQQLQEKQDRIEELNLHHQQAQANLEHYHAASLEQRQHDEQRFQQILDQNAQTLGQLQEELTQICKDNLGIKQINEQLVFEKNNLVLQLNQQTAQGTTFVEKLNAANMELAKQTSLQQHWQAQHESIYAQWEEQRSKNTELQTELAVITQKLTTTTATLEEKLNQNKKMANEKWILGQEKAQLFGQLKQLESQI